MTQDSGPNAKHAPDDDRGADAVTSDEKSEKSAKPEHWWEDPNLPFKGKPTRAEMWCWSAFAALGVYGLVMAPLRPVLLRMNDYIHVAITGSGIALINIGATLATEGAKYWWVALLIAGASVMKFDWIFWWAGRLWGHSFVESMGSRNRFVRRWGPRVERACGKYGPILLVLVWLVPFIPSFVVHVGVGDARMKLRTFLVFDYLGALLNRSVYVFLGYQIGYPARDVIAAIAKYSLWISIVIVVVLVFRSKMSSRKKTAPSK